MAVGTAEYNYEFMKDLRLAVFGDIGNAYDKGFTNDTKIGAGVGVRWASPVGQVRVDVATGVKEEGNPIKLHFFYWHTILIQLSLLFYLFYDFISPTDWRELIILTICD